MPRKPKAPKRKVAGKDGKDLQRLIHAIESALQNTNNVKIESPKRLVDKDTGRLREHDVVLTFSSQHHELLIALECRDRSRPIGVPDVEAFWSKCQRTGVNSGIMVSSKGFTGTAIRKANSYSIGCLALEDAPGFDWCLTPGVSVVHHDLIKVHLRVEFASPPPEGSKLELTNSAPLTDQEIRNWALKLFDEHLKEQDALVGTHTFHFIDDNPAVFYSAGDNRIQASKVVLTPTYAIQRKFVPFEFRSYFDKAKSRSVTNAAVALIEVGGKSASVVLSEDESGLIKMSVVPTPTT